MCRLLPETPPFEPKGMARVQRPGGTLPRAIPQLHDKQVGFLPQKTLALLPTTRVTATLFCSSLLLDATSATLAPPSCVQPLTNNSIAYRPCHHGASLPSPLIEPTPQLSMACKSIYLYYQWLGFLTGLSPPSKAALSSVSLAVVTEGAEATKGTAGAHYLLNEPGSSFTDPHWINVPSAPGGSHASHTLMPVGGVPGVLAEREAGLLAGTEGPSWTAGRN